MCTHYRWSEFTHVHGGRGREREREVGCGAARKSHRDMIHYKEATKQGPWWLWGRESFPVSIRLHFALVIPAAQNTVEQLELEHRRVTIWRHINHSCAERQRDRGQMAFHLPSFMKSYHRPDWPVSNCTAAKTSWTRSASDRGSRTHKRPRDFVSGHLALHTDRHPSRFCISQEMCEWDAFQHTECLRCVMARCFSSLRCRIHNSD